MSRNCLILLALTLAAEIACAVEPAPHISTSNAHGSVSAIIDEATGWSIYTIQHSGKTVRVVPEAGFNVFSIVLDNIEYLRVPDDLSKLRGVGYGTPILYPMPNRVRGARFEYEGRTYEFPPNGRGNFIHGLVHSVAWRVTSAHVEDDFAELHCSLPFHSGSDLYQRFPFEHVLSIGLRVSERGVRWTYKVSNTGTKTVPFGFALHPYFNYLGDRSQTFLQVSAKTLMESHGQLPTGKLVRLDHHRLDARTPVSLAGYTADDVFFGVQQDPAAVIDYRDKRRKIALHTSQEFSHCVVYTPDRPFFCVENQTCSTDAHNLASQGMGEVAHLQECGPGEAMTGWVEYRYD